jgi:hypothetical protein
MVLSSDCRLLCGFVSRSRGELATPRHFTTVHRTDLAK